MESGSIIRLKNLLMHTFCIFFASFDLKKYRVKAEIYFGLLDLQKTDGQFRKSVASVNTYATQYYSTSK